MNHLTEEQLVLHHYHDDDGSAARHLDGCDVCRSEYGKIRSILALVDELPIPDRGPAYGELIWNRLRWRLGSRERNTWRTFLAAAALLAIAFFAGQFWHARSGGQPPSAVPQIAENRQPGAAVVHHDVSTSPEAQQRVLVVVVGDHLESSERMLAQVANADAQHDFSLGDQSRRATELLASNRMYRQTADKQGDARIASLLADLEPILVELSHADKLSSDELKSLQKRIDSKGLLFKVRVVSAETSGKAMPAAPQKGTDSL
jgi:hypothetical protein